MSPHEPIEGARLLADVPARWSRPAQHIAETLQAEGHRAWIVGGCVRDLVLERPLGDLDVVSAARPDEIEALFDRTIAVGKSFGVVIVVVDETEVEVATFRLERGYSDRRRPDAIEYANSPLDDARRRDFTCNALYLDPLDGTLLDPTGGIADLRRGELRAVGEPRERFREDGLRILRMARFLAALDLGPAPGLLEAAREESEALEGVSPERVLNELVKVFGGPRPHVALDALADGGHADRCLPGWADDPAAAKLRPRVLEELGDAPGTVVGLTALLEFAPLEDVRPEEVQSRTQRAAEQLRTSRDVRNAVATTAALRRAHLEKARGPVPTTAEERGALVSYWRLPQRRAAEQLAFAWARVRGDAAQLARLGGLTERAGVADAAAPEGERLLRPDDLVRIGVPKGPQLGVALVRVENARLGGAFDDRKGALEWARANLT
ncbi:MAG: CCA tRNA nucleotidyltransferase [Planctomycetota bacterium]